MHLPISLGGYYYLSLLLLRNGVLNRGKSPALFLFAFCFILQPIIIFMRCKLWQSYLSARYYALL
jgi:hypothetical protein